jgi:hypothetical protein
MEKRNQDDLQGRKEAVWIEDTVRVWRPGGYGDPLSPARGDE